MERRKAETIEAVLQRYLRFSQLETPLYEHRLIQAWGQVAGAVTERYTSALRICNQILYVRLRSSALRSELMLRKSELVRKLNEAAGSQVIKDICFN